MQPGADDSIHRFDGAYRFLSNFYLCTVERNGWQYISVEHAYQAAKAASTEDHDYIANSITAFLAKRRGGEVLMDPMFEVTKLDIMHECLRSKFSNRELRTMLLSTGNRPLIEGNTWGDHYWGVCRGRGENWLGRLLMRVREECR